MGRPSRFSLRYESERSGWCASTVRGIRRNGRRWKRWRRSWAAEAGLTATERQRLKDLERENRELKRANEILWKASALFAQAELDRRAK